MWHERELLCCVFQSCLWPCVSASHTRCLLICCLLTAAGSTWCTGTETLRYTFRTLTESRAVPEDNTVLPATQLLQCLHYNEAVAVLRVSRR